MPTPKVLLVRHRLRSAPVPSGAMPTPCRPDWNSSTRTPQAEQGRTLVGTPSAPPVANPAITKPTESRHSTVVLEVLEGPLAGNRILWDSSELVLGRKAQGAGMLGWDPHLSRWHAALRRTADGNHTVRDLGSTNGTFVNGRRIAETTGLNPGDELSLGSTRLRLVGVEHASAHPTIRLRTGRTDPADSETPEGPGAPRPGADAQTSVPDAGRAHGSVLRANLRSVPG